MAENIVWLYSSTKDDIIIKAVVYSTSKITIDDGVIKG